MSKRVRNSAVHTPTAAADDASSDDDEIARNAFRSKKSSRAFVQPAKPKNALGELPDSSPTASLSMDQLSTEDVPKLWLRIGGSSTDETHYFASKKESQTVTAPIPLDLPRDIDLKWITDVFTELVNYSNRPHEFQDFVAGKYVIGIQTTISQAYVKNVCPSSWVLDIMAEDDLVDNMGTDIVVVAVRLHAAPQPPKRGKGPSGNKTNPPVVAANSVQLRLPSSSSSMGSASASASASSSSSDSLPLQQETALQVFCNGRKYAGNITCDMSRTKRPNKAISDYLADVTVSDPLTYDNMVRAVRLVLERFGETYTPETWMVRILLVLKVVTLFYKHSY